MSSTSLIDHIPVAAIDLAGDCTQANGAEIPVAVINLDHRHDRWATLVQRFAAVGIDKLIRASAVNGRALDLASIRPLLGTEPAMAHGEAPPSHLTLTPPAIGCFLSHLGIWRRLIEQNIPRVLIMEDDASPAAHFAAQRFRETTSRAGEDVGLLFLGRIIMNGLAEQPRGDTLPRLYYFNGTFAYVITPAMARRLMTLLLPMRRHIDHQMSQTLIAHRGTLAAHYTEPHLFEPDWNQRSDCYVPLVDEAPADVELGAILRRHRDVLLEEGRPLIAP